MTSQGPHPFIPPPPVPPAARTKTNAHAGNTAPPPMGARPGPSGITHYACAAAWIARVHGEVFPQLHETLSGQSIALLGSAPSLRYAPELHGCRTIACGRSAYYLLEHGYAPDFFFAQDYNGSNGYIEDVMAKLPESCTIMLGIYLAPDLPPGKCVPMQLRDDPRVRSYATGYGLGTVPRPELENFPLADYGTAAHAALHFALYAGAERIYLLGCDTTNAGFYDQRWKQAAMPPGNISQLKNGYAVLSVLQKAHWPKARIISVNPVGLRGMFEEVWTEGWLREQRITPGSSAVVESI